MNRKPKLIDHVTVTLTLREAKALAELEAAHWPQVYKRAFKKIESRFLEVQTQLTKGNEDGN